MKLRKFLLISLAILVILALAAGFGIQQYRKYQDRFIMIDNVKYEKTTQVMDLSNRPLGDLEQLRQLPDLQYLNLHGTGLDGKTYDTLRSWFPEAEIFWDIPFQGAFFPMETQELTITTLAEEDLEALAYFSQLKTVNAQDCRDYAALDLLRQARTDLDVRYTLSLVGTEYAIDTRELVISGMETEALAAVLPYFTDLQKVELVTPLAPVEDLVALMEMAPETEFTWNLELGGIPVNEKTETLDLTNIPMTVEEMDAVLPYLLNLTRVEMTGCGISNEEMDALNLRYENIKIVWTVRIGWRDYKTDIDAFMPARDGMTTVYNSYLYNLRYCHDVIALDIGHMEVTDISFVAYMPHLKFLLLGDTRVSDLSPLEGLTELVYLELFMTNITECDALLTLTALEDLNVSYTYCDAEVLSQMTWLKNLWWAKPTTLGWALLPDALANTHLEFNTFSSTGNGWRDLPNYFAQRDIFGLGYMTG